MGERADLLKHGKWDEAGEKDKEAKKRLREDKREAVHREIG